MLYDPPDGWRYGFPKPFTPGENLRLALIRDGYPAMNIDDCVLHHCRFIGNETEMKSILCVDEGCPHHGTKHVCLEKENG